MTATTWAAVPAPQAITGVPPGAPPASRDSEKYAYINRNLPYLTITLVVSATCLIISQIRFELHDPVLWPFMVFTATYVALPGDQPAGELHRPWFRPGRPPGAHPGLAAGLLPQR